MTLQRKLRIANILMLVGILPLVLGISWIVSGIVYAQQHKGQMGGSDAFLMIGVLIVTYAFALLLGGGSSIWSAVVARRNAGIRATASKIIRISVWFMLAAPLVWYFGLALTLL
jgi:hypothetical protein